MSDERFTLDTNVLVYGLHREAGARWVAGREIIDRAVETGCVLTLQALGEFYAAVTRKRILVREDAAEQVQEWLTLFPVLGTSAAAMRQALKLAGTGRVAWWDAVLLATAAEGGCTAILSEDFALGTSILGVRIERPFEDGSISPAAMRLLAPS